MERSTVQSCLAAPVFPAMSATRSGHSGRWTGYRPKTRRISRSNSSRRSLSSASSLLLSSFRRLADSSQYFRCSRALARASRTCVLPGQLPEPGEIGRARRRCRSAGRRSLWPPTATSPSDCRPSPRCLTFGAARAASRFEALERLGRSRLARWFAPARRRAFREMQASATSTASRSARGSTETSSWCKRHLDQRALGNEVGLPAGASQQR